MASIPVVNDHFVNKDPAVRALYDQLLNTLNKSRRIAFTTRFV